MSVAARCECYGVALVRGSCGKCGRRARPPDLPTPAAMEKAEIAVRDWFGSLPSTPEGVDLCRRIAHAIDEERQMFVKAREYVRTHLGGSTRGSDAWATADSIDDYMGALLLEAGS